MCVFLNNHSKLFRISARWHTPLFRVYVFLEAISATNEKTSAT